MIPCILPDFSESVRVGALDFVDSATGTTGRHDNPRHELFHHRDRDEDKETTRSRSSSTTLAPSTSPRTSTSTTRAPAPPPRRSASPMPRSETAASTTTTLAGDRESTYASDPPRDEKYKVIGSANAARRAAKAQAQAEERGESSRASTSSGAGSDKKVVRVDPNFEQQPVAGAFGYWDPETSGLRSTPPEKK